MGGRPGVGGAAQSSGGITHAGGAPSAGGTTSAGGQAITGGTTNGSGGTPAGGTSSAGGTPNGSAAIGGNSNPSSPFDPCPPAPTPCAIMALGDSITDGYSASDGGGYRVPLFRSALADNKHITFVGSGSGGPATVEGVAFPDAHEGHSGAAIDDLVQYAPNASGAQIVLVMAGTNGCESGELIDCYAKLLEALFAAAPNALIVAGTVIPTNPDGFATFNAQIPQLVTSLAASGKHVVMADLYTPFLAKADYGTAYLVDYAHPNDAGYRVMADVWYGAIKGVLH